MSWQTDVSGWTDKPDSIQVFSDDGQEQDYVPERTCKIEDCYFEDVHHLHRAMETDEWFGSFGKCSLCGEYIPVMNYCPNCGAEVVLAND